MLNDALGIREKTLGPDHPAVSWRNPCMLYDIVSSVHILLLLLWLPLFSVVVLLGLIYEGNIALNPFVVIIICFISDRNCVLEIVFVCQVLKFCRQRSTNCLAWLLWDNFSLFLLFLFTLFFLLWLCISLIHRNMSWQWWCEWGISSLLVSNLGKKRLFDIHICTFLVGPWPPFSTRKCKNRCINKGMDHVIYKMNG